MMKVIVTDLGNVICTYLERQEVMKNIVRAFGGDPDKNVFLNHIQKDLGWTEFNRDLETGTGLWNLSGIHQCLLSSMQISGEEMPYVQFFALWFSHLAICQDPVLLCRRLQKRGYKLFAASNCDDGGQYLIKRLTGFYDLRFDRVFLSAERKCQKPELLQIIKMELEGQMHIPTQEAVFVDDNQAYLDYASALGFKTVFFNLRTEGMSLLSHGLSNAGFAVG
jgi:FMN phosphatase YigB (HAD superfamily)